MDGVVQSVDLIRAATDSDGGPGLDALVRGRGIGPAAGPPAPGGDGDHGVLRGEAVFRLDAISAGDDREGGILHGDISPIGIGAVVRADAVCAGGNADGRPGKLDAVLAAQSHVHRLYGEILRCDHKVVIGDESVLVIADDAQLARAVDGQIVLAEHGRVQGGLLVGKSVIGTVGNGVLRPLGGGDEHLVRIPHIDGGALRVGQIRVFQHDLDLVLIAGVHHDHLVLIGAGQHIDACLGDGQVVIRRERHGLGFVIGARRVPLGHRGVRFRRGCIRGRGLRIPGGQQGCPRGGGGGKGTAHQHQQRHGQHRQHFPHLFIFHSSSPPSAAFRNAISRFPFRQRRASIKSCTAEMSFSLIL